MKRNEHKIVSKKGLKYEIDRASWSTYANFKQMYNGVIAEFVDAGVAKERELLVWMNRFGNEVEEKDAFGCKVTHDILHPDYIICMDEVGGNTSQKGDGHIGGELMLCETGTSPQRKINTKDKHYTVLGLTTLSGKAVMCCVIFAGVNENPLCETGFDWEAEIIGKTTDTDFVKKNTGKGKLFPGGPVCDFQGKKIPCFCRWSPKGSITTEILRDILATLDKLEVYERKDGIIPCVLLDGHGSRFGLPFLQYITDPEHEWCVVIGVPYGTALWQVGDSFCSHNTASAREKRRIVENKESHFLTPTIEPHEIIDIVSVAWEKSFSRVETNKNAISERGWFPFNRNLMTYPCLRATMTDEEKKEEDLEWGISLPHHKKYEVTDLVTCPTFDPKYEMCPVPEEKKAVNFSSGFASFALDKLVSSHDLMSARERIRSNHEKGMIFKEQVKMMKTFTAGQLFKAKGCRIGKDIHDIYVENMKEATARYEEELAI